MGFFSSSSTTKSQQQTTPTFGAGTGLNSLILQTIQKRLQNPSGVPAGYVGQGIQSLNDANDSAARATENALTARGLAGSPIAANADLQQQLARTGQIGEFRANVPLVARDLQNQDLGLAGAALGLNRGYNATGTSTTTSTPRIVHRILESLRTGA